MNVREALARVVDRRDLTAEEMAEVVGGIMDGQATPAQIGGLLVGLRMKGEGRPASTPTPSCTTSLVLPCSSSGARTTSAPKASAMAWWPRHTPSRGGLLAAHACTKGMDAPARSGVPGPGDRSTPSKSSAALAMSASVAKRASSLRQTCASTPSWPRYWTRLNTKLS